MKYLGAYMLAVMGGNASPSAADIKKILETAGIEIDDSVLTRVMSELEGKDVMELITEGKAKLSSVPSGGAGAGGAAAAGGDDGAAPAAEEAPAEESEEEEEEMDFDLFD